MRIALITNMASPYRLPVWDTVAGKVDMLRVFLCAERESNRIWQIENLNSYKFEHKILPGRSWHISTRDWGIHWNPTLWGELRRYRPTHIIVTGYETPSYLMAIAYAKVNRVPLVIWWGSHALSSRSRRGAAAWMRRRILRVADAFVTYGTMATDYLISMGIPSSRVITGMNTVDVERISRHVDSHRSREDSRQNQRTRFLYVGQLIERKGVRQLLNVFRALPKERAELVVVGYGPLEEELRAFVNANAMHNVVFAGGTRTPEETARYYAWADVLVMPSLVEVWGLVVNEALAAGLWVLASKYAGATHDLIEKAPLAVGKVFDPADSRNFTAALLSALENSKRRNAGGIVEWGLQFTPKRYGGALLKALERAKL